MENTIVEQERCKLFLEQNKLLWGRLQTAHLVEAGALTAYYVTRESPWLSIVVLILSVILLYLLFLLVCRDVQHQHNYWHPLMSPIPGLFSDRVSGRGVALLVPIVLILINVGLAIWTYLKTVGLLAAVDFAPALVAIFGVVVFLKTGMLISEALREPGVREAFDKIFDGHHQ